MLASFDFAAAEEREDSSDETSLWRLSVKALAPPSVSSVDEESVSIRRGSGVGSSLGWRGGRLGAWFWEIVGLRASVSTTSKV